MKSARTFVGFSLLSMILFFNQAQGAVNVAAVAGMNIPSVKYESSVPVTSDSQGQANVGFGALLGFGGRKIGLETGVLYLPYQFKSVLANSEITTNYLTIPILLRFNLAPWISIGAGVSYGMRSGATQSKNLTTFAVTSVTTNDLKDNLSATGSLAVTIPLAAKFGILLDGRYLMGLSNLQAAPTNPANSTKYGAMTILAGLKISL